MTLWKCTSVRWDYFEIRLKMGNCSNGMGFEFMGGINSFIELDTLSDY